MIIHNHVLCGDVIHKHITMKWGVYLPTTNLDFFLRLNTFYARVFHLYMVSLENMVRLALVGAY